jgi:hypothetical protein
MNYLEPGQRWRLPSGNEIQVISLESDKPRSFLCAQVIGGVLRSLPHEQVSLLESFIQKGHQTR